MSQPTDDFYQKRIAELEAENARLRQRLDVITADRRDLYQRVYGPTEVEHMATEEDYLVVMRTHIPGSGARILAELGITPRKPE